MTAAEQAATAVAVETVTPALQLEIERFLYREARLLDERRFDDWYALLADDLRYLMPTRYTKFDRELDREFATDHEAAHFDEDKQSMQVRIARLKTGRAWAENPPSRTRHMVSNVVVTPKGGGEYAVDSYFMVYWSRMEREVETLVGMREDLLRRCDGDFLIARRLIRVDQTVLLLRSLSFFI